MNGSDVWQALIIFLIFIILFLFNILSVGIKNIKENWPEYRCNPLYMPFSKTLGNINPNENFTYCVQNMQADYMGNILKPVNYSIGLAGSLASDLTSDIQSARTMMSFVRNSLTGILDNLYDTFLNIIIEFQKTMITMGDSMNKVVGMMSALMNVLDGVINSMKSGWNGPPGQLLQALGCFSPETKIRLASDRLVMMKDLNLGDKLKNGSIVMGIIRYNNVDSNGNYIQSVYEIPGGEDNETVYVTGEHFVWDGKIWNYSKNNKKSTISKKNFKEFSCLCTSDNKIQLGENLFWDYNDTEEMQRKVK